jgi:hypothetical protein
MATVHQPAETITLNTTVVGAQYVKQGRLKELVLVFAVEGEPDRKYEFRIPVAQVFSA